MDLHFQVFFMKIIIRLHLDKKLENSFLVNLDYIQKQNITNVDNDLKHSKIHSPKLCIRVLLNLNSLRNPLNVAKIMSNFDLRIL